MRVSADQSFGMKRNETEFWSSCKCLKTWWPGTESNRRRQPFQGCNLPILSAKPRSSAFGSCDLRGHRTNLSYACWVAFIRGPFALPSSSKIAFTALHTSRWGCSGLSSGTMDKIRDPSKQVPRNHAKYRDWVQYLSAIDGLAHRFNSDQRSAKEAANYLIRHFDATGRAMLESVGDYSSALVCGRGLDSLVPRFLAWFHKWIGVARLMPTQCPSPKMYTDLRRRLMRRAEFWKAQAQVRVLLPEESVKERGARRQRILKPLLKKAGITSDEVWAERADPTMDRNTPRDYRLGKTKKLRRGTRQALAQALAIPESKLPA